MRRKSCLKNSYVGGNAENNPVSTKQRQMRISVTIDKDKYAPIPRVIDLKPVKVNPTVGLRMLSKTKWPKRLIHATKKLCRDNDPEKVVV